MKLKTFARRGGCRCGAGRTDAGGASRAGRAQRCRSARQTPWPTMRTSCPTRQNSMSMTFQSSCPMPAVRRSASTRWMNCWAARRWRALPTTFFERLGAGLRRPGQRRAAAAGPPTRPTAATTTSCAATGWKASCRSARAGVTAGRVHGTLLGQPGDYDTGTQKTVQALANRLCSIYGVTLNSSYTDTSAPR